MTQTLVHLQAEYCKDWLFIECMYMYRQSCLYINWCYRWTLIFPTVSWVYFMRECYHETSVHNFELDNSQLRQSIIVDHAHNGVMLTQDNCCDWCIFITSQNIMRHLSFKTEYHATVTFYEMHSYNLPSLDDGNYTDLIYQDYTCI